MSKEAQDHMITTIRKVLDTTRQEFDITFSDMLGCLEFVKAELIREMEVDAPCDEDDEEVGQHEG